MNKNKPSVDSEKKVKIADERLLTIEALLNLIPYAGGFLATYFGEIRTKRLQERMTKYKVYFTDRLNELEQTKIDKKYMESEEFAELFVKAAEQAARSVSEKKIRRFADILINNILIDSKSRFRTESIISFVERLSDLDIMVLVSYGMPHTISMRANSKDEISFLVRRLALYLGLNIPSEEQVIESVVYMDNLGLTWVNEKNTDKKTEKGEALILKEFSSFRTPLGNEIVKVITPPDFFVGNNNSKKDWPDKIIDEKFRNVRCL
jgi:hypothetical protein